MDGGAGGSGRGERWESGGGWSAKLQVVERKSDREREREKKKNERSSVAKKKGERIK